MPEPALKYISGIAASRYADVRDRKIHFLEAGSGFPVVLIHGWLCWGAYWRKIIPRLAQHFRILAPDLPGHGLSDKTGPFSTDAQAEFITDFLAALGVENAHVVGHSMGGEIAAKVAIMAPNTVAKLALLCAAGPGGADAHLPYYVRAGRTLNLEAAIGSLMGAWLVRRFGRALMFHPENDIPDEFVEDILVSNLRTSEDRAAMVRVTREGLFRDNIDNECRRISHPTWIASARYDRIVVPAIGERYRELIGNSTQTIFEHSGHMLPWEEAEALANGLIRHLN